MIGVSNLQAEKAGKGLYHPLLWETYDSGEWI
jgi:hypothetical protein